MDNFRDMSVCHAIVGLLFANTEKLNIIASDKSNFVFILYCVICILNKKFGILPCLDFVFLICCLSKLSVFEVEITK